MAGESQREPTPGSADPSVLTTEALQREVKVLRKEIKSFVKSRGDLVDAQLDVLRERFRGMDQATKVLHETVTRTPTEIQNAIGHLNSLMDEKFTSIETQFQERDTRQERESRDDKVAVDAAFAAQKEAAAKQDEGNQKAIDKSERATNETIQTLGELFRTTTDGLKERQANLENALTEVRSLKQGGTDQRQAIYAFAGFLVALVIIGGVLVTVLAAKP